MASNPQIVVETLGGVGTATDMIHRARRAGCRVVTANKQALATDPVLLADFSRSCRDLLGAATVGGSLPGLEIVSTTAEQDTIVSLRGIINGTCNYILDRVHGSQTPEQALHEAQAKGLAEADPHLDLSGVTPQRVS